MSGTMVSIGLLVALIVGAVVRDRAASQNQLIVYRLALAVLATGAALAALWGHVEARPLVAGLWIAGGLAACGLPVSRSALPEQLPGLFMAAGPVVAALVISQLGGLVGGEFILDGLQAVLTVACGALLAFSMGMLLRAGERLESARSGLTVSVVPLAAAGVAALAFRRLASLGPDWLTAYLPVTGSDGRPVLWMTDYGSGMLASSPQYDLGLLILAGVFTCVGAALIPSRAPSAVASAIGGGLLLGAVGWILSLEGLDVDLMPQSKEILASVNRIGVEAAREGGEARIAGRPPVSIATHLSGVPLAMLITAGLGALGAGAARWLRGEDAPMAELESASHHLAARDAIQIVTVCVWLALAVWLFQGRQVTGLWGPSAAPAHILGGAAFAITSLLFVLHGVGSQSSTLYRALRGIVVSLAIALLAGVMAGGLVSSTGLFEF